MQKIQITITFNCPGSKHARRTRRLIPSRPARSRRPDEVRPARFSHDDFAVPPFDKPSFEPYATNYAGFPPLNGENETQMAIDFFERRNTTNEKIHCDPYEAFDIDPNDL